MASLQGTDFPEEHLQIHCNNFMRLTTGQKNKRFLEAIFHIPLSRRKFPAHF